MTGSPEEAQHIPGRPSKRAPISRNPLRFFQATVASRRSVLRDPLPHIRAQRIVKFMVFVELTPFIEFRRARWTDEDLRSLQNFLLATPDAGDVIRGGAGLRKLRWAARGQGKRGGARIIYFRHVPGERIYLIYGYVKSEQSDLSPDQIKMLAKLMKGIEHG